MKRATLKEIKRFALAAKQDLWMRANEIGRDVKLYLHWSAGHYGQFFPDYHINIDQDGCCYIPDSDFAIVRNHTYMRNSASIGISLSCAAFATSDDLGDEPPTKEQIESLARVISVLADALDLTIDLQRVMTHGEAADNEDGIHPPYEYNGQPNGMYGPKHSCERWDLAILQNGDEWGGGGQILRGKANWYRNFYKSGVENYFI